MVLINNQAIRMPRPGADASTLAEVFPGRTVDVALYWQHWAHEPVLAQRLADTCHAAMWRAIPLLRKSKNASIVNISSGAGILGVPNRLSYVASKFGISGITKSMSPELGPLGIRVNAVAPGVTRTPLMEYALKDPVKAKAILAAHPIGRIGEPEEIAAVIVFLLSDDASFMTGSVVSVDGGQTACL